MPEIKGLVKELGQDQETAFKANRALMEMVTRAGAPEAQARRDELASALAAELTAMAPAGKDNRGRDIPPAPVHAPAVRSRVALLLSYVGGADAVPALVEAMKDLGVREAARMSLDRNRSEEATDALVRALDDVGPVFLAGVVNSLGRREGPKVLQALQKAAGNDDPAVRMAALNALANLPDPSSDAILAKASAGAGPEAAVAAVARLRLAETLRRAGNRAAAAQIYQSVSGSSAPEPQKKAARAALATSA